MQWIKRIAVILIIVAGIIFLGKIAPNIGTQKAVSVLKNLNFTSHLSSDSAHLENPEPEVADSSRYFPWKQILRDSLFLRYSLDDRYLSVWDSTHWLMYMPRGRSLLHYSLELKELCETLGIKLARGRVTSSQVTTLQHILVKGQDSLKLDTRYARSYLKERANFSLVFMMPDSLSFKELELLNKLDIPLSLIVNPHGDLNWLAQLEKRELRDIVCLLAMEPFDYPIRNPGEGTLLLHHNEEKIARLLEEKLERLPTAKGFASYYGQRAIENKKWLKSMLIVLQKKAGIFLDLTESQRSYAELSCREIDLNCRRSTVLSGQKLEKRLKYKSNSAYRYGEALVVAKWSIGNAKIVLDVLTAKEIQANGLKMIKFSQMENY